MKQAILLLHINVPRADSPGERIETLGGGARRAYLQARQSFKDTVAADPGPWVLMRSGLVFVLLSSASIQLAWSVSLALPLSAASAGAPFCWSVVLSPAKMGLTQAWEGPMMSSRSPINTLAIV
jgi:hypothetical protein